MRAVNSNSNAGRNANTGRSNVTRANAGVNTAVVRSNGDDALPPRRGPRINVNKFLYLRFQPALVEQLYQALKRKFTDPETGRNESKFNNLYLSVAIKFYDKQLEKLEKTPVKDDRDTYLQKQSHKLRKTTLRLYSNVLWRERQRIAPLLRHFFFWNPMVEDMEYSKEVFEFLYNIDNGIRDLYNHINESNIKNGNGEEITPSIRQIEELMDFYDQLAKKIVFAEDKSMTLIDLASDQQFQWMYLMKFMRFSFVLLSLYLAEKIFYQWYVRKVYSNNEDPPDLLAFVGIFLILDLTFNIMIFVILFVIKILFESNDSFFVIDSYFLKKYVADVGISMLVIFAFCAILASIIQKKKYFRYKLEGPRAMGALKEMMTGVVGLLLIVPYFLVV